MDSEKVEEWIKEVEQRPSSAPLIIQYIARRVIDLTKRNQELLADNIQLRTEKRVEEYENKISSLEYQLNLLKRQLSGIELGQPDETVREMVSLLLYDTLGRVLRIERSIDQLQAETPFAQMETGSLAGGVPPRLLVTDSRQELMFVFDSGRLQTRPVASLPAVEAAAIGWQAAVQVELRPGEELVAVTPIGKMTLFDYCLQVSRRGCAKRMMQASFENYITSKFIGAGTKMKSDKTCCLAFARKEDQLVLASKEGYVVTVDAGELPYTTEEIVRLSATDHINTAFVTGGKPSVIFITQAGKVIHREIAWLEKIESYRSRGQAVFSASRRDAGVRVVGAAAVDEEDWGMLMDSSGRIFCQPIAALLASGAVEMAESAGDGPPLELVGFAPFNIRRNQEPAA